MSTALHVNRSAMEFVPYGCGPPMNPDFRYETLHQLLKSIKDRGKVRYVPNRGNAGDSLIAAATWQVFERLHMTHCIETGGRIGAGDNVIYAGGGNLIPEYKQARKTIEECMRANVSSFILLPHSIRGNEDLLQQMDDRFHLFCRERQSYAHARRFAKHAQVYLTHDLVFGLDLDALNERTRTSLPESLVRLALDSDLPTLIAYLWWRVNILAIKPQHPGEMCLMRVDAESSHSGAYPRRYDLSSKHQSAYRRRCEAELVSRDFFHVLDRADHIVSDRLHVCIGGALLGKKVTMLDNSYGKNGSVFLTSMQENFPHVAFAGVHPGRA
jgi:exopolysaccharide biosynthesis predicted pyruvyltransferase EpsI